MVNAKFRKAEPVWFRNSGCAGATLTIALMASIENLRRIESFGFFTNFPRFSFNADTRGLSTPVTTRIDCEINRNGMKKTDGAAYVLSASHGVLAWPGTGAAAPGENARFGE